MREGDDILAKTPAIFLDRDGVIIKNRPDYVRSWADVTTYPQALSVLARVSELPYKIVIVTNQSVVGRGGISLEAAEAINERLVADIAGAGGRVDGVFMCPHAPQDRCGCRKPRPGLLLQAAQTLAIDLSSSWMIGDALTDVMAGRAAGVACSALVLTGRGQSQMELPEATSMGPFPVYDDLTAALNGFARQFANRGERVIIS